MINPQRDASVLLILVYGVDYRHPVVLAKEIARLEIVVDLPSPGWGLVMTMVRT